MGTVQTGKTGAGCDNQFSTQTTTPIDSTSIDNTAIHSTQSISSGNHPNDSNLLIPFTKKVHSDSFTVTLSHKLQSLHQV